MRAQIALPQSGPFKVELEGISRRDQIGTVLIGIYIFAPEHTNKSYDKKGFEVIWEISSNNDNRIDVFDYTTYEKPGSKFYDLSKTFQW